MYILTKLLTRWKIIAIRSRKNFCLTGLDLAYLPWLTLEETLSLKRFSLDRGHALVCLCSGHYSLSLCSCFLSRQHVKFIVL